jgi:hypothetical protein
MSTPALILALDSVHTAILTGQLTGLAHLTQMIGEEAADLTAATQLELQAVRQKAARNALCLQAAMRGIRAAQRRLAELRQASAGHVTYDQKGQRTSLGTADGSLRQRI